MTNRGSRSTLDPEFLIEAYMSGFFPMADPATGAISWYSPDPRAILPIEGVIIPRSLRAHLKSAPFEIHMNRRFEEVVRECGRREETWITEEIVTAYTVLNERGHAHSIEAWRGGSLVGGLYGVALGGAFFGESMFSRTSNASKVALVALTQALKSGAFLLHDTQFLTDHLKRFGAIEIPRKEYLQLLARAVHSHATIQLTDR
ncbi:MAG: leucyl/phenylalanyl-tRNA--protein transferase [Ignavibacteria bacterium]|nr:leucyl/phenylalanyl-tRNA--protein transferase [Ignavibacteria bacterium]